MRESLLFLHPELFFVVSFFKPKLPTCSIEVKLEFRDSIFRTVKTINFLNVTLSESDCLFWIS